MTEYAEVARAESERGEVVLRRRIEDRAADVLELRPSNHACSRCTQEPPGNYLEINAGGSGLDSTARERHPNPSDPLDGNTRTFWPPRSLGSPYTQ